VKLEETLKGFAGLIEGRWDAVPEASFYNVGNIEEAVGNG
jgi:F-type H+-transporting ATPase subunit beta